MIRAYDEYGNVVDLVEREEWIRQDERKKCIAQIQFKWEKAMIKQIEADIEKYIRADERKKVIGEVIALARAEIDFESQAEQARFVEFMEGLKEQMKGGESE